MGDSAPEIGSQFGPYLIRRLIGRGGMGSVFEAEDTVMDRIVALKLITGEYARDSEYRARLQREARIAGRLHEPHVVPIHSAGEIDGRLYVDMRLIDGTDLDTVLKQSGPLAPERAVSIIRQIAAALDAAHAAGVLHRDVKPANILISDEDFAYLVDFGIANAVTDVKLTQQGYVLGTFAYMAPERFSGDDAAVTVAADTYALACVLFEALTGSPPYRGDPVSLMGAHLSQPVPQVAARTGLPPALDAVIARGMAKDPQQRYGSAGEFARDAAKALGVTPDWTVPGITAPLRATGAPAALTAPALLAAPAPTTLPPPSAPTPSHRRGRTVVIGAALGTVVALAAGIGIWKMTDHPPAGIDLTALDVGHYRTQPLSFSTPVSAEQGRYLEGFRLAEAVPNPYDVDPALTHLYGFAVPDPATMATTISGTGTPLVQPVLEKYGMVSAYVVEGVSKRLVDFAREKTGDMVVLAVSSFPNDHAAAQAAGEMDATDFTVNPENQAVAVPGHPEAKAHWRPGSPSIGATAASGRLVISIAARSDATPTLEHLQQLSTRILDLAAPLLNRVIPTPASALTALAPDPDNVLSRLFTSADAPQINAQFGSMGPRAALLCVNSGAVAGGLLETAGVDRCAFGNDGSLLRASDESAARDLSAKLSDPTVDDYIDHPIAGPDGVPDTHCYEHKQAIWSDDANSRFACRLSFGRYTALVLSNEDGDVRHRAAAQYAILANA